MLLRAFGLYRLIVVQHFRRIYYSFATELVISICSGILLALFYYIFSDFLATQVAAISASMRTILGNGLSSILLGIASLKLGLRLSTVRSEQDHLAQVAERLGENPQVLRAFRFLETPSLVGLYYLPTLGMVMLGFVEWQRDELLMALAAMSIVSAASWWYRSRLREKSQGREYRKNFTPLLNQVYPHALYTLWVWRIKQMIFRDKSAQILLSLSLLGAVLNGYWSSQGAPLVLALVLAFGCSLLVATALILRISADCHSLWIEKNCGVSHELYLETLQVLACTWGGVAALSQVFCLLLPFLFGLSGSAFTWGALLKLAMVSFTSPFLVPYLALQIDGKRSGVQIISLVLVSLLLTTAIFAHSVSFGLLPLVAYYGLKAEKGRFYYV